MPPHVVNVLPVMFPDACWLAEMPNMFYTPPPAAKYQGLACLYVLHDVQAVLCMQGFAGRGSARQPGR
jgi:hypothetical protein